MGGFFSKQNFFKACKKWDIPFLLNFLYKQDLEISQFFDISGLEKNPCLAQNESSFLKLSLFASKFIEDTSFRSFKGLDCAFDSYFLFKDKKKLESLFFTELPNRKSFKNKIIDISHLNEEKFLEIEENLLWLLDNKESSFYLELTYPYFLRLKSHQNISGFFLEFYPSNKDIQQEYNLKSDYQNFSQLLLNYNLNAEKKLFLNFYLDYPGQSFEDILNDFAFYKDFFFISGFQIYPFHPDKKGPWGIFEAACFLNLKKLIHILLTYKPDWLILLESQKCNQFAYKDAKKNLLEYSAIHFSHQYDHLRGIF